MEIINNIINFKDLRQTDHSASNYQSICQRFSLIFLFNLPKLTPDNVSEAKRFMLFIDEIYENKTALIITAKVKLMKFTIKESALKPSNANSPVFKKLNLTITGKPVK